MQKRDTPQLTSWPAESTSVAAVAETNEVPTCSSLAPSLRHICEDSKRKQRQCGANKTRSPSQICVPVCVWSTSLEQTEPVQSRLEGAYASLFLINIKSSSPGGPDEKTPRVSLGLPFGDRYPRNILTLRKKKAEAHAACGLHGLPKCRQKS